MRDYLSRQSRVNIPPDFLVQRAQPDGWMNEPEELKRFSNCLNFECTLLRSFPFSDEGCSPDLDELFQRQVFNPINDVFWVINFRDQFEI